MTGKQKGASANKQSWVNEKKLNIAVAKVILYPAGNIVPAELNYFSVH